jgi:hypothetical protein
MNTWNKIFSHPVGDLEGLLWGDMVNSERTKIASVILQIFNPIKVFKTIVNVITKYHISVK